MALVSGSGTKRQIASISQRERRVRKRSRSLPVATTHRLAAKHSAHSFHSSPWMIGFASIMIRRARFPEATHAVASRRRAPSPWRYYDVGQSSIVEWQSGVEDQVDGAARRFYTLRDLELRLEHETAVLPSVLIFHCSRCGSTLLARLLEIDPANRVFLEPQALRQFLHLNRMRLPSPETRRNLRILLQSYGLEPSSGEKRLIFKLNSLAVHSLAAIRAALPEVAFIYMLRDPAEVVASISRATPVFLRPENRASLAAMIGLDPGAVIGDSAERWWSRYVEWNLSAAYAHARDFTVAVDYREFATRFLAVARRWSDRTLADDEPEVVETLAFHSKNPGVRFSPIVGDVRPGVAATATQAYLRWGQRLGEEEAGLGALRWRDR